MPIVTVPRVVRERLGDDVADALVALINQANGQTKTEVLTFVEEKFERRLSEVGAQFSQRITEVEAKLDRRITDEAAKVSVDLAMVRTEMAEHKADLLRWMFIFWVGQVGALLGILFAFFRR